MKYFLIGMIRMYQMVPGPWHALCRHTPTCSNYGIEAIGTFGSMKGGYLSIVRILKCNPWGSSGYDPVPRGKGEKNEKEIKAD